MPSRCLTFGSGASAALLALAAAGCGRLGHQTAALPPADASADTDPIDPSDDAGAVPTQSVRLWPAPATPLSVQGTTQVQDAMLVLTENEKGQAGSAFWPSAFVLTATARFEVHMVVRITGTSPAHGAGDGMVFTWHNDPTGPKIVGAGGGGSGYEGIAPSMGVELDTFWNMASDVNGNHIGVLTDGQNQVHLAAADPGFMLASGQPVHVWIDYAGASSTLDVYASRATPKPARPILSHVISLLATVGARCFVGVTAGTGEASSRHEVLALDVAYWR